MVGSEVAAFGAAAVPAATVPAATVPRHDFFVGESFFHPRLPARSILRSSGMRGGAPSPHERPAKPPFKCMLHLPLGSLEMDASVCHLGRSSPQLADDPRLSRQHALIAFDSAAPRATITWMAKKPGRVRSACARSGDHEQLVYAGAQRIVRDGDVITLLAEAGRHVCLVSIWPASDGRAPSRPDARSWALIEADALAAARAAAKHESAELTRLARAAIAMQEPPPKQQQEQQPPQQPQPRQQQQQQQPSSPLAAQVAVRARDQFNPERSLGRVEAVPRPNTIDEQQHMLLATVTTTTDH